MAVPLAASFTDQEGEVRLEGDIVFAAPSSVPAITGALSTVADAPAKAVLTSIIAALVDYGFATNGTT